MDDKEFIEKVCKDCKNRNEYFCEIRYSYDGKIMCAFYEKENKNV